MALTPSNTTISFSQDETEGEIQETNDRGDERETQIVTGCGLGPLRDIKMTSGTIYNTPAGAFLHIMLNPVYRTLPLFAFK